MIIYNKKTFTVTIQLKFLLRSQNLMGHTILLTTNVENLFLFVIVGMCHLSWQQIGCAPYYTEFDISENQ